MNFIRALSASIFRIICSLSLGLFIVLLTVQMTVLNPSEVKSWVRNSGTYQTALSNALNSSTLAQAELEHSSIPTESLKTALNQTFPASYVQSSTELAIDSAYSWADGKASDISFQINTTEKKNDFVRNLAAQLEPQIAGLPRCASIAEFSASDPRCIPPGYTAKQLADSLATDAGNSIAIFRQPITNDTLAQVLPGNALAAHTSPTKSDQIPQLVTSIRLWTWILPIIAVLSGALVIILSRDRWLAAQSVTGRLTWGAFLTMVISLGAAYIGTTLKLSDYISTASAGLLDPIIKQAAPSIGLHLAAVSGSVALITGTAWIILRTIRKRRQDVPPASESEPPALPSEQPKLNNP